VDVWVGDPGSADSGRVTLFRVDQEAGRLETGTALLSAVARSNVAFDKTSLIYTAPGGDGKTYIVPVPEPAPTPAPTPGSDASEGKGSPPEAGAPGSSQPGPQAAA
jgi:hypothetical protein